MKILPIFPHFKKDRLEPTPTPTQTPTPTPTPTQTPTPTPTPEPTPTQTPTSEPTPTPEPKYTTTIYPQMPSSANRCELPPIMPRTEGKIGNVTVSVAGGDMTQIKADAYVVPEFDSCISEGGVGGAIYRSGAGKGMEAYGKHLAEHGKLKLKDVFVAEAGGGKSKYLIHAVSVGADDDKAFEVAQDSVYNSLKAAQEKGIKSVVIPAIGTGIIGSLTNTESANAILSGVKKFADEGGEMDVCAVVYSTGQGFKDFSNALKSKGYEQAKSTRGTKQFNPLAFVRELSHTVAKAPRKTYMETQREKPVPRPFKQETLDKLLALKGKQGKALLTERDMEDLTINYISGGKPIPHYEERIIAVISNPEEINEILKYDNPAYGIWRAILDPLNSTIKANPGLFNN